MVINNVPEWFDITDNDLISAQKKISIYLKTARKEW